MAESPSSAILTLLDESIAFHPDRADLWMMRFDALRLMGQKREFQRALAQAMAHARIRRDLDWAELRRMWEQVAPGEPFPQDAEKLARAPAALPPEVPDLPAAPARSRRAATAPPPALRRFNDIAAKIAGPELAELAKAYGAIATRPGFLDDFARRTRALLRRPTPLEYSETLSRGAGVEKRVYLKREDLRGVPVEAEHAAAQCYIASLLGKNSVVTANDVDLHALEVATAATFFKQVCTVVVRPDDARSKPDFVAELKGLGARVVAMPTDVLGTDPREGAVRVWLQNRAVSHLVLSLGMAPAPYMAMANAFQGLLGRETLAQYDAMAALLKRPRTLVAAVGSEADALGFVLPFLNDREIRVAYAEPEPGGVESWRPSARLRPYNGQKREHSWLRSVGRIQHVSVPDADARAAQERVARDGLRVGLEDARAIALAALLGHGDPTPRDFLVLVA